MFLQLKQARRSVVARFVHGDQAWHAHQGQRVVQYQKALQTVSDPLLGWTTVGQRQYYVRQFRDMKGAVVVDGIDAPGLADYGGVCGVLVAKGHARSSGASMIAGYLGRSDKVADALCRFAQAYADQTEHDHAALLAAIGRGVLPAERGVRAGPRTRRSRARGGRMISASDVEPVIGPGAISTARRYPWRSGR